MANNNAYKGKELELFSLATKWKKYFSAFILPYIKGDVLEVGAGTGNTTSHLQKNNSISSWTILEPDPTLYQIIKDGIQNQGFRVCVNEGDIHSIKGAHLFDTIIYIDVLEHIENDRQEMEMAHHLLKKDGKLIILSPAHQFLFSPFDHAIGHFRRYNKKSLSAILPGNKFIKIKLIYLDSVGGILSLGNKFFTRQAYPTKQQVKFWDRYVIKMSTFIDLITLHKIGKSIAGIWQKI